MMLLALPLTLFGQQQVVVGAAQTARYISLLENKSIALVVNHTSVIGDQHLLDTLLSCGIDISLVFAPEHGFRGDADAGEMIAHGKDSITGVSIISIYGKNKKPSSAQLDSIDVVVFDIQDVGVRFYTYISTLHFVMEACAENGVGLIVLDRPNPNGDYVDGPVLDTAFRSFVGVDPIPIVHGLTVGELALMINGEGWLNEGITCDLTVVTCQNWTHSTLYDLPIKPSPNLPNYQAVRLYPSLCLFEATAVSVGRGTYFPFQVIGFPDKKCGTFSFTPIAIDGMSNHPKQEGKECFGQDLREGTPPRFTLHYFLDYYQLLGNDTTFVSRIPFFNMLAGNETLLKAILDDKTEAEIRKTWQEELLRYKANRRKYLLYLD